MYVVATPVFSEHLVSTGSTTAGNQLASESTSAPVQMQGNHVAVAALVHNIDASSTLTFGLQGSYDGSAWEAIGSTFTKNTFGYESGTFADVDYALVRLALTVTGTNVSALVSATLSFSAQ